MHTFILLIYLIILNFKKNCNFMFKKGCLAPTIVGAVAKGEARSLLAATKTSSKEICDAEIRQEQNPRRTYCFR